MEEYESSSSSFSQDNDDPAGSDHVEGSIRSPSHTCSPSDDDVHMAEPAVESLLDLAVKVTAKHLSCEDIQQQQPVQDDNVLKKLAFWACPQDIKVIHALADVALRGNDEWNLGQRHVEDNHVHDMTQVGFMVSTLVESHNVYFTFEKQQITSTSCDKCPKRPWCSHVIAAIIYRIENSSSVSVHAPVMESLATLNRDQLLKLLHYAIDEDPGGVLRKVFSRIGPVQDPTSDMNTVGGLPDPTFGQEHDAQSSWDLILEEFRSSFRMKCNKNQDMFPSSLLDSTIKSSLFHKCYLQRVVNLVNIGRVKEAGQLLMTLVTEASNILAGNEITVTKGYEIFMRKLENICCLYILKFTGESRSQLVQLCQNLNRNLKRLSMRSNWTDLPAISSLFPFEFTEESQDVSERPKCLFYEPVCAHIAPDPPKEFFEVLNSKVETSCSIYDEPLALMCMRFETLRLWKKPGKGESELVRLGAVIIRKLLQMSQKFSISNEQDIPKPSENQHNLNEKRKLLDEKTVSGSVVPAKKRKTFRDGWASTSNETHGDANNSLKDDTNTETDREQFSEVWTLMADIECNDDKDKRDIWVIADEWLMSSDYLSMMIYTTDNCKCDVESVSKEQLAYCLMHTCCSIYDVEKFDTHLTVTEKRQLVIATLRALEYSRFRFASENRDSIKNEEISAWHSLVQKLIEYYNENIGNIARSDFSSTLENLYMKKLCNCNRDGVCFFENAIPLELIVVLVKRAFNSSLQRNHHNARCLCLYTLCHSNMPLRYYAHLNQDGNDKYTETNKNMMKLFSEIAVMFLQHINVYPDQVVWLKKLLGQYETTQDGMALKIVWKELGERSSEDHSEDIQTGIFKLLLNLITLHNNKGSTDVFHLSEHESCKMIELWCKRLKTKAVVLVLSSWEDVATFFRGMYRGVDKVIEVMLSVITPELLSSSIINSIFEYLRGSFKHTVDSCRVIDLCKQSDEHLEGAFAEVMENKENYTPDALLYVAEMYHINLKQSMKIPADLIFSKQVEEAIIIALKGMFLDESTQHYSDSRSWAKDGRFMPSAYVTDKVEWVFKALMDTPANMVNKCYQSEGIMSLADETFSDQFEGIMSLAAQIFSDDLSVMLGICSLSAGLILDKCKVLFGEHIIRSMRSRTFEKLEILRNKPRVYEEFKQEMSCVERHFSEYTLDGGKAYEQLCSDIKRKYKRKRKLMSILGLNN